MGLEQEAERGMILDLPFPPTGNTYWRHFRGRVVVSTEARKYRQGIKLRALTAGVKPLAGPVCVNVTVYRPRQIGDLDNSLKVLLDALRGVAFEDDKQVVELHALRLDDKSNPRAVVRIEPFREFKPVIEHLVTCPKCESEKPEELKPMELGRGGNP